eukprot:TRINITY_DN18492_c0_g1_i1.p1 TRINITY_DN18492_c0_g1~~TRINITY_DN18492_c0_g1_i1.p1  ORF type:complete len:100 (-),score=0.68 TRINITY_DN18492_c0_g1_i1:243-542(-)
MSNTHCRHIKKGVDFSRILLERWKRRVGVLQGVDAKLDDVTSANLRKLPEAFSKALQLGKLKKSDLQTSVEQPCDHFNVNFQAQLYLLVTSLECNGFFI